jgi:hypothetical protein
MLKAGAGVDDPLLEAVLLDDAPKLHQLVREFPQSLHQRIDLLAAFTSCRSVTALHVCAEFNSVDCARVLLENGADGQANISGLLVDGKVPAVVALLHGPHQLRVTRRCVLKTAIVSLRRFPEFVAHLVEGQPVGGFCKSQV